MLNKNIIYFILSLIFSTYLFSNNLSSNKITNDANNIEYFDMFDKVFNRISDNYVDSLNHSEILISGIKGLFSPLDPYSKFLTGRGKENLDILRTGKYGGVGIKIGLIKDTLTVISVYEESPAYSEGVFPADQILRIDSTSTEKLSVRDASSLIKGEMGTKVTFHIYRPSSKSKFKIDLMRAQIKVKHLPYFGINDNGVGYIRLTKFSKNSSKDFKTALNVMNNNKKVFGSSTIREVPSGKGLLLQLRNPSIIEEVEIKRAKFLDKDSKRIPIKIFTLDSTLLNQEFDVFTDLPSESIFLSKDKDKRGNIKYLNIWYNSSYEISSFEIEIKSGSFISTTSKGIANSNKFRLNYDGENELKGLIIDLRSNSGGLLSQAKRILEYIVPRGDTLLVTKGRNSYSNETYVNKRRPIIDEDMPIAVLINKGSASASEIVAGVIQDLDRGIVLGKRSFGKGLVQRMYNINDTTTIKITTSKYYTPSGRLIQKEDYFNKGSLDNKLENGDSLYFTKGGRVVKSGGGIYPDIILENDKKSRFINSLWRDQLFIKFATQYIEAHNIDTIPIVNKQIIKKFKKFVIKNELNYTLEAENYFVKLKNKLNSNEKNGFLSKLSSRLYYFPYRNKTLKLTGRLFRFFKKEKKKQFKKDENINWIRNGISREFARAFRDERSRIRISLSNDKVYQSALEIIMDYNKYLEILTLNYDNRSVSSDG